MPQDRTGQQFSVELFEPYQRSEHALLPALVEMYIQGVSTRKARSRSLPKSYAGIAFRRSPSARSTNDWIRVYPICSAAFE